MDEEAKKIVQGLIKYLKLRRQLDLLPLILGELEEKAIHLAPENIALITTAYRLGNTEKRLIKDQLQHLFGRKLRLKLRIDPQVIGGIMVKVSDKVIDLSLNKDLEELSKKLKD